MRYNGFIGVESTKYDNSNNSNNSNNKNEISNENNMYYFMFIEADLSNNEFDKVQKYNEYYKEYYKEKNLHEETDWYELASGFPRIVVLTHRRKLVEGKINKDNEYGLEFEVLDLGMVDKLKLGLR